MKKANIQDYTETEFLEFLNKFDAGEDLPRGEYGPYIAQLVKHFDEVVEHPAGTDLIFYPKPDADCTPEGWLAEIKAWIVENGKPGFKPE